MHASESDPFGIHYLKFFMTVMILIVHSLVFTSVAGHAVIPLDNPDLLHLAALIPNGLLIPMTAGAVQAIALRDKFVEGRLFNFEFRPFVLLSLALAFIESFKAALVYEPSLFFAWNALHFLAVALLVALLFARLSIHLVWLSGLLSIALTPWMKVWLLPFQVQSVNEVQSLNEYGLPSALQILFCLLALGLSLWWVFVKTRVAMKYKARMALVAVIAFNLALWIVHSVPTEYYFAARILNLPVGALVGDKLGMHFWPFFPWYSGVAIGFAFYYFMAHAKWPKLFRQLSLGAAAIGLAVHFIFLEQDYISRINRETVWSDALFNDHLSLMVFCISSFVVFALGFEKLVHANWWQRACIRMPALWRVPFVYSKTIFWAYLFINTFGVWIGGWVGPYLHSFEARGAFAIGTAAAWYWIGELTMKWLSRTKITVRLSPAR